MLVVVPDDQLSLAIGRGGQNVRLASHLLGWRIDVKSEDKYGKMMEEGFQTLTALPGIDDKLAEKLYDAGLSSAGDLAEATPEELCEILNDYDLDMAAILISSAKSWLESKDSEKDAVADTPPVEAEEDVDVQAGITADETDEDDDENSRDSAADHNGNVGDNG
jgi:N utilization substance protein A